MNLKSNKGITGVDISVALIVMVLFVGIIASLVYNFGVSSRAIDRKAEAIDLVIQVIEDIKQMDYGKVKEEKDGGLNKEAIEADTGKTIEIKDGYTLTIKVKNYKDEVGDSTLKDVMKIVTVKVEYTVGKQNENVEIKTVITQQP